LAVTPSVMSVHAKENAPSALPILLLARPDPSMCTNGRPDASSDATRLITSPERCPASTTVPYNQTSSASELVRKGLRVVASRYYKGRRPPTTRLFESTDMKLGDESELFRDLED
jgi:hypothetical protein